MNLLYLIPFFVVGLFFGSFYTVVGCRLPQKASFIVSRSHCDSCQHTLSFLDMIPILSFFLLRKRCRYCHGKIDSLSTWMEFITGVLFALSYFVFGFSYELLIALGIVSMLIILSVSDISYMIIPDEILIFFAGYFILLIGLHLGMIQVLLSIGSGLCLFSIMYAIMMLGNAIFKKETLGGGDIKMMFVFGLILSPLMGIISIFLGSILALPVSMILLYRKNQRLIPFGPFLLISFTLIYFTQINSSMVLSFLRLF